MSTNSLSLYWRSYGGLRALIQSPYLWLSLALTALLFPHWSKPLWWDDVLSIMPNVLGFSLGGYAMWMAIGDDNFRKLISGEEEDGEPSPYMEVNSAFVHFIILQILSIILSLIAKAYYFSLPSDHPLLSLLGGGFKHLCLAGYAISYFVFVYAIVSAFSATFALLSVSYWYDRHQSNLRQEQKKFVNRCATGKATADEIETYISRWQHSDKTEAIHNFLGMTLEDYQAWKKNPKTLNSIIEARREALRQQGS